MEERLEQYLLLAPLAFVALWFFVLSIIARVSGWSHLAEYYRADDFFDGAKRHFQSISMGAGGLRSANLNGAVTIGVNASTLRLSVMFPFRPFHPPLAIPLSDLSAEFTKVLLFERVSLRTARAPGIAIAISRPLAQWIEENSGGLWRAPGQTAPNAP